MIKREHIEKAMKDMLQIPTAQCLYKVEVYAQGDREESRWLPVEYCVMSYIDACTKALTAATHGEKPVRVFMCPEGRQAFSPVFEIKQDGSVVLSGQEIGNVNFSSHPLPLTREGAEKRIGAFIQHRKALTNELEELLDTYGEKAEELLVRIADGDITSTEWAMKIFDNCEVLDDLESEDPDR